MRKSRFKYSIIIIIDYIIGRWMILDILLLERTRKIPTGFRPSSSCATGTEHAVARSAGPGRPLFFLLAHALAQQLAGRGGQGGVARTTQLGRT